MEKICKRCALRMRRNNLLIGGKQKNLQLTSAKLIFPTDYSLHYLYCYHFWNLKHVWLQIRRLKSRDNLKGSLRMVHTIAAKVFSPDLDHMVKADPSKGHRNPQRKLGVARRKTFFFFFHKSSKNSPAFTYKKAKKPTIILKVHG